MEVNEAAGAEGGLGAILLDFLTEILTRERDSSGSGSWWWEAGHVCKLYNLSQPPTSSLVRLIVHWPFKPESPPYLTLPWESCDMKQMSTVQFICLSDLRTTHHLYRGSNTMVPHSVLGKTSLRLIYFSKISLFSMLWIHVAYLGIEGPTHYRLIPVLLQHSVTSFTWENT